MVQHVITDDPHHAFRTAHHHADIVWIKFKLIKQGSDGSNVPWPKCFTDIGCQQYFGVGEFTPFIVTIFPDKIGGVFNTLDYIKTTKIFPSLFDIVND